MTLEDKANITQKDKFITDDIWNKAKSMAILRKLKIGQWLAEAIVEKYNREYKMFQPEAQDEKSI